MKIGQFRQCNIYANTLGKLFQQVSSGHAPPVAALSISHSVFKTETLLWVRPRKHLEHCGNKIVR